MPKYHMDFNGTVYRDKMFNSEKPVYVIDAADWERLVELLNIPLLRMLLKKMASELAEIDSIIAKVKEANSHE